MKLRIAGIELFIGYDAAAALTAVLLLDRENHIVCCILAALLHELGHLLMMLLCGVAVRGVRLRLFDILIEADEPRAFRDDVLITLGGAAVNLLCAAICCPFSIKLGLPHLALGIFNLLPILSLDGGHLLRLILSRRYSILVTERVMFITTTAFIVPLMTAGILVLFQSGYNYSLLVISLYLTALLLLKK